MSSLLAKSCSSNTACDSDMVDVDITPVMNMFIILIPFLISMAVFTQVSILQFSLPPNTGSELDQSGGNPKLKLTVVVAPDYYALTYGERMLDSIPSIGGESGSERLKNQIGSLRPTLDIQDETIVAVKDNVSFQRMVEVMDVCRKAGFEKIGVSSATVNAVQGI